MGNNQVKGEPRSFLIGLALMAAVFAIIMPLVAMMYIDILAIRSVVQEELAKTVKLRKQLERESREPRQKAEEKNE